MFSKSVKFSGCELSRAEVEINNAGTNEEKVPQLTVRDHDARFTMVCTPHKVIYEVFAVDPNNLLVELSFDAVFPEALLISLTASQKIKPDFKSNKLSLIFEMNTGVKKEFDVFLNLLQGYLARKHKDSQSPRADVFDELRRFVKSSPRKNYVPVHTQKLFFGKMRDQMDSSPDYLMLNSAFGQGSNTAKRFRRS
jgi:hypothetical protein